MTFTIDIELTNRCNASCHFCPRDQTPHQGLMSVETFAMSLERAVEYREVAADVLGGTGAVSLCGLGEPLLNKHAATFVGQVRDAGFPVHISSNAALLDERRAHDLLDAGLQKIFLNVGDRDADYEEVYQLPFERTLENVLRFNELAEGRCEVYLVLVDYRRDAAHQASMREYWQGHGITRFQEFPIMNRGGALFVDHMQFEALPQLAEAQAMLDTRPGLPLCGAPFGFLFIGFDGNYYLCCSDWKKDVPLGHVADHSFLSVTRAKLERIVTRDPICRTCNLDPLNHLTDELRARDAGEAAVGDLDAFADQVMTVSRAIETKLEELSPGVTHGLAAMSATPRKLIPLTVR